MTFEKKPKSRSKSEVRSEQRNRNVETQTGDVGSEGGGFCYYVSIS